MRIYQFSFVIVIAAFFCIIQACKKADSCKNINCVNGGKCDMGTCTCPAGFTGSLCETKIHYPTSNYINSLNGKRNFHSYTIEQYFLIARSDDATIDFSVIMDTALYADYSGILRFSKYNSTDSILAFDGDYGYKKNITMQYYIYNDSVTITNEWADPGGTYWHVYYSYR